MCVVGLGQRYEGLATKLPFKAFTIEVIVSLPHKLSCKVLAVILYLIIMLSTLKIIYIILLTILAIFRDTVNVWDINSVSF